MTSFPKDILSKIKQQNNVDFMPSTILDYPQGLGKSTLTVNFLIKKNRQISSIKEMLSYGIHFSNLKEITQKLLQVKPSGIICEDRYERIQDSLMKCAFEELKKYFLISQLIEYKNLNDFDMNFKVKERDISYLNTLLNILNYKRKEFCIVGSTFENQTIKSQYSISFISCIFVNTKVECVSVCSNSILNNSYFEKYDISSNYSYWASNKYKFHKKHHFYNNLKALKEKLQLNMILEYCEESSISKVLF